MGKEQYWHWGGRFSKRGGDQSASNKESSSPGCMSGVLHLFDFHQFQFPITHQPCFKPNSSSSSSVFLQDDPLLVQPAGICKGVQAPRNSLESEENLFPMPPSSSPSQATDPKHGDHDLLLHVPAAIHLDKRTGKMGLVEGEVARIRIDELSSSEGSGSPGGPKTPTLVARLMGLDLLPEQCSPSLSSSAKGSINNKAQRFPCHSQDRNNLQSRQLVQSNSKINRKKTINNSYYEENSGSRSLPETPRISSARRSDVDASRLSLQINKENTMISVEFDYNLSRPSSKEHIKLRRKDYHSRHHHDEEDRSPSHYARQLVKQVKESVSRRAGMDITNTTGIAINTSKLNTANADHRETVASKSKKRNRPTKSSDQETHHFKHSTSSNSPRIRSQEYKIKPSSDQIIPISKPLPNLPLPSPPPPATEDCNQQQSKVITRRTKSLQATQQRTIEKCKKATCERFTQRKEPPIRTSPAAKANLNLSEKKCKKTPSLKDLVGQVNKLEQSISSNQAHANNTQDVPTHQSKTTQQQQPGIELQVQVSKPTISQLSSSSSRVTTSYHEYHHQSTLPFFCRDDNINRSTTTGRSSRSSDAEFRYVTEILKRTGIDRDAIVSFTAKWFSPSHPLDPSIFHYLEQQQRQSEHSSPLAQRHNRKLIFDLVDEILVDILKPYLNVKPWLISIKKGYDILQLIKRKRITGIQLLQQLCSKIQSFPSANCQILQDIDDLIELDLPDHSTNQLVTILPILKEGEWIVFEIERDLLDSLVLEIASAIVVRRPAPANCQSQSDVTETSPQMASCRRF